MKNTAAVILGLLLLLPAHAQSTEPYFNPERLIPPSPDPQLSLPSEEGWYRDTVFYHIWVRSFADSDGDGIGDLRGLISRLDYLNDGNPDSTDDLGITGIWLSPILDCADKGPRMHGYDTRDFYKVNPLFGTNADLDSLLMEAHRRGIRVIMDFVPNLTSNQHPWFLEAKKNGATRDWYVWNTQPEPTWTKAWGGGTWKDVWHEWQGSWYYSAYTRSLPDLNFHHRDARTEITNALLYWWNRGFDGARIDSARYLVEDGPGKAADRPGTHEYFRELRKLADQFAASGYAKVMMTESWTDFSTIGTYFGNGKDENHMSLDFPFVPMIRDAVATGNPAAVKTLGDYPVRMQAEYPAGFRNGVFLSNHDEAADRPGTAYGGRQDRINLAAAVSLIFPGTPILYYGHELGMKNGPGTGDMRMRSSYPWPEAEAQSRDSGSVLGTYRKLIRLRNDHAALRGGGFRLLPTDKEGCLAFLRDEGKERVLGVMNFTTAAVDLSLDLTMEKGSDPMVIWGSGSLTPRAGGKNFEMKLQPHSMTLWSMKRP